jgi:Holliday junction resolvasome RuvABC endonuclease subunit
MLLCIDPGFANYGCSVIDAGGEVIDVGTLHTIKSKTKLLRVADDDVQRIVSIVTGLSHVITKYQIQGVLGELPPSNSQSAKSAKGLAMAVALSVALFTERGLPMEWATPNEVKQAMTGKKSASKEDMMKAACDRYGWKITEKKIFAKKTNKVQRIDRIYHPLNKTMGKNAFEHIADSLGAYEALKHTNVAKMYLQPKMYIVR